MRIINETVLVACRQRSLCEICGLPAFGPLDACHAAGKGAGRIDASWNVFGAHRRCHSISHNDREFDGLKFAALREGVSRQAIQEAVFLIRRLPKACRREQVERELLTETHTVRRLVRRALKGSQS